MRPAHGLWSTAALAGLLAVAGCQSTKNREVRPDSRPVPAAPAEVAVSPAAERGADGTVESGTVESGTVASGTVAPGTVASGVGASGAGASAASEAGGAGASSVSAGVRAGWPDDVDLEAGAVLASVGGRAIRVGDFFSNLAVREPALLRVLLDDLVISRILVLEAGRLGLEPPGEEVQALAKQGASEVGQQASKAGYTNPDDFIRATVGIEPEVYLRRLTENAAIESLAPRCVRAWLLASDRRDVRVIAVEGQSARDEVMARLARGEAFESVARDLSLDASREDGGRFSPLVRSESVMARMAFATEVGSWTGPVRSGGGLVFLKVEAKPAVLQGAWTAVGSAVEASLSTRPVDPMEISQWKEAMLRRHDVDTQPFLDLIR